jgi:hypothetical protein
LTEEEDFALGAWRLHCFGDTGGNGNGNGNDTHEWTSVDEIRLQDASTKDFARRPDDREVYQMSVLCIVVTVKLVGRVSALFGDQNLGHPAKAKDQIHARSSSKESPSFLCFPFSHPNCGSCSVLPNIEQIDYIAFKDIE